MIGRVMNEVNNHFIISFERVEAQISGENLKGSFKEEYEAGMYIHIQGSLLNTGTYKIIAITENEITLDTALRDEKIKNMYLYGLNPSREFLEVVAGIEEHTANISGGNIASEKQGDKSISYAGDNKWQTAFINELETYRNIYDDLTFYSKKHYYNLNVKW